MSSFDKQAGSPQFFGFASFAPQLFGMPSFIYFQAILEAHFEKICTLNQTKTSTSTVYQ